MTTGFDKADEVIEGKLSDESWYDYKRKTKPSNPNVGDVWVRYLPWRGIGNQIVSRPIPDRIYSAEHQTYGSFIDLDDRFFVHQDRQDDYAMILKSGRLAWSNRINNSDFQYFQYYPSNGWLLGSPRSSSIDTAALLLDVDTGNILNAWHMRRYYDNSSNEYRYEDRFTGGVTYDSSLDLVIIAGYDRKIGTDPNNSNNTYIPFIRAYKSDVGEPLRRETQSDYDYDYQESWDEVNGNLKAEWTIWGTENNTETSYINNNASGETSNFFNNEIGSPGRSIRWLKAIPEDNLILWATDTPDRVGAWEYANSGNPSNGDWDDLLVWQDDSINGTYELSYWSDGKQIITEDNTVYDAKTGNENALPLPDGLNDRIHKSYIDKDGDLWFITTAYEGLNKMTVDDSGNISYEGTVYNIDDYSGWSSSISELFITDNYVYIADNESVIIDRETDAQISQQTEVFFSLFTEDPHSEDIVVKEDGIQNELLRLTHKEIPYVYTDTGWKKLSSGTDTFSYYNESRWPDYRSVLNKPMHLEARFNR